MTATRFARISLVAALGFGALISCSGSEAAADPSIETANKAGQRIEPDPLPATTAAVPQGAPVQTTFEYSGELTQGGYIRGTVPTSTASATLGEETLDIAEDGTFFAAFDRDSENEVALSATLTSGEIVTETLTISDRDWQIERVNVARRKLRDPEAYWRQREPEHNAIVDARAKVTGATGWQQEFIWPVKGRISGRFGRQRIYRGEPGSYHSGIDIAPGNGVPFVAPADGVVVLARTGFSLEGGLIIIDHGAGLNSSFLHCSRIVVEEGEAVRQGQHIGNVGSTGRSTGPHLHWGLKWNDARFDPILLAGPMS